MGKNAEEILSDLKDELIEEQKKWIAEMEAKIKRLESRGIEDMHARIAELEAIVENQEEILDGFDKALNRGIAAENPDRYARWAGALYAARVIIKAAGDEDPIALIEAAKKLPRDALGGIVTLDSPLWGWVSRYDGTPGEVHQQNWMTANRKEIAKCYPTIGQAREAAEAARGGGG